MGDGEHAIVFAVADEVKRKFGYTWLLEWSTESFYLKSTFTPLQSMKVSIHGPNAEHPDTYLYKAGPEHEKVLAKAVRAGAGWRVGPNVKLPLIFPGRRVNRTTEHLIRYSVAWDMFCSQVPSAPLPTMKQKATLGARLAPPPLLRRVLVDVYVSHGRRPYWPDEKTLRSRNAGLGPITNSAGMHLTAVSRRAKMDEDPDPCGDLRGDAPLTECVRGMVHEVDPSGFLWMCEKLYPRSVLTEGAMPRGAVGQ